MEIWGRIDILVNNAGYGIAGSVVAKPLATCLRETEPAPDRRFSRNFRGMTKSQPLGSYVQARHFRVSQSLRSPLSACW